MFEEISEALDRRDLESAEELLQNLRSKNPENPWFLFYQARLEAEKNNLELAEELYKGVLLYVTNTQIVAKTRRAINQLETVKASRRKVTLAKVKEEEGAIELGILILEPINSQRKQLVAQKLAKIFDVDVYTARLQIPNKFWRICRTGAIGELRFYTKALEQGNIPCFCVAIPEIANIEVQIVDYFQSIDTQVEVICHQENNEPQPVSFDWEEVTQRVTGALPIFTEVTEKDARGKPQRKITTSDYVHCYDLHLAKRNLILRICDRHYQFNQGVAFLTEANTTRLKWNKLSHVLDEKLSSTPLKSNFKEFAASAMEFREMLKNIKPHLYLSRREETPWDAAFELYSSLALWRSHLDS